MSKSKISPVLAPEELWRAWIIEIANDPEMDMERAMRHLQKHVQSHMPNADAPEKRWEEWLAGSYNLLAILGCMVGIDPKHPVGIGCLMTKWLKEPTNYTPPPKKVKKQTEEYNTSYGWNS